MRRRTDILEGTRLSSLFTVQFNCGCALPLIIQLYLEMRGEEEDGDPGGHAVVLSHREICVATPAWDNRLHCSVRECVSSRPGKELPSSARFSCCQYSMKYDKEAEKTII